MSKRTAREPAATTVPDSEEVCRRGGRQIERRWKGGKRGRGGAARNKMREPTILDVVADSWDLGSLLDVSGVPGASPVDRGRDQGTGHRIGPRRTERSFVPRSWERKSVRRAPKPLGTLGGRGWRCSKYGLNHSPRPFVHHRPGELGQLQVCSLLQRRCNGLALGRPNGAA
jgi:hypothetical protein